MSYNSYNQRGASWGRSAANDFRRRGGSGYSIERKPVNKSDCKIHKDYVTKSGAKKALFVKGWKYTKRRGLIGFIAVPASSKYQKGKAHTTMVVQVTSDFGVSTIWGYWNYSKQILSMPSIHLNAGNGWASYLTPKNARNRR